MFRLKALLGGLVVLLVVAAMLAHDVRKDDRWDPDGFLYTRMMLVDTGLSEDDAHRAASRFFLTTPAARDPDARDFYGARPPAWYEAQYPLFRARPLYPQLAALRVSAPRLSRLEGRRRGRRRGRRDSRSTCSCCSSRRRGWRSRVRSPAPGRRWCATPRRCR